VHQAIPHPAPVSKKYLNTENLHEFTGFYQTPLRDSSFLLIDFAAAGRAKHALG
jgi:hypothetical protein